MRGEREVIPYALPLKEVWRMAGFELAVRRGFLVRLSGGADGLYGLGDAPLLPRITGTGAEELERALRGESPVPPEGLFALSTARLDLEARRAGITLAERIASGPAKGVAVNAAIGGIGLNFLQRTEAALKAGFRVLKIKTAILPWAEEREALMSLAARLPEGIRLRLDANRGWPPGETPSILAECAAWPVEAIEEPCPWEDFAHLAALQEQVPFALAIDESLPHLDRDALLRARPARRLIVKPAALGDLAETFAFARQARRNGFEVTVTCAVDTAIGVRAALHLAAALDPGEEFAHGLATSDWLERDVAPPPVIANGRIALDEGPGLGVELHHAQAQFGIA